MCMLSTNAPLTQLPDYDQFKLSLVSEWRRAIRGHYEIALILIDVDHFKPYIEACSRAVGEQTLSLIASEIQEHVRRAGDVAARFDSDEFAILLPNTTLEGALRVAQGIRAAIEELDITNVACANRRVTVSVGVAASTPDMNDQADILVAAADAAVAEAKRQGRNRVHPTA